MQIRRCMSYRRWLLSCMCLGSLHRGESFTVEGEIVDKPGHTGGHDAAAEVAQQH